MEEERRDSESVAELRAVAARHGARYEVLPEMDVVDHRLAKVGFRLLLWGLHEHPRGVQPGCAECVQVYRDLAQIAEWIVPKEDRPSRYEIEPFDRGLHAAPDLKDRDEVRLEVKILHRHDWSAPIDPCEERCLADMRRNLRALGISEGPRRPRPLMTGED
jgi:hypothetical protein